MNIGMNTQDKINAPMTMEEYAKEYNTPVEAVRTAFETRDNAYRHKSTFEELNFFERISVVGSYYSRLREEREALEAKSAPKVEPKKPELPEGCYPGLYYGSQFVSGMTFNLAKNIDQRKTEKVWRFIVNGKTVVLIPKCSDAVDSNGRIVNAGRFEYHLNHVRDNKQAIQDALMC